MKPLAQMTREELWALEGNAIYELAELNDIDIVFEGYSKFPTIKSQERLRGELDTLRLELQQDAAEARNDSNQDR